MGGTGLGLHQGHSADPWSPSCGDACPKSVAMQSIATHCSIPLRACPRTSIAAWPLPKLADHHCAWECHITHVE